MDVLAAITIGIDPNIFGGGWVQLSWHGFFTFVAVAVSVFLVHRWGTREGLLGDPILSVSVWAIIGGIVGARAVHVLDFWGEFYSHDPFEMVYVWQGGIAIYGAVLGGFLGGAIYIWGRQLLGQIYSGRLLRGTSGTILHGKTRNY